MPINITNPPPVLETYFLDEARIIPTAKWTHTDVNVGFLGSRFKRFTGTGITAGWAMTVKCLPGDILPTFLAMQFIRDRIAQGRWVLVLVTDGQPGESDAAHWNYMQSRMAFEAGFVGAVIGGMVQDVDEINEKLENGFGVFAYGTSPLSPSNTPEGVVGSPIKINDVIINSGDLIIGDNDGVICVPRDMVESVLHAARERIILEVNQLQHVREGLGAVEVLELTDILKGNVELVD
ncbi:MAG: RraA family protein [bacterium]